MKTVSSGEKIGKYINYQRGKRGMSINEFAKHADITPSFLLRLEKGAYQSVGFEAIEKLANGFQMSVGDFLYKCELISGVDKLPPIEYYMKEKYQLPEEGIQDILVFVEYLKMRYKKQIKKLKSVHKEYWRKKE